MKKKLTKQELLEKLDVFRKKIKYYHDTLAIGMAELSVTQTGTTPDQIKNTTAHLRQSLRKMWGFLEKYYINMGIKITFPAEDANQQKIDIFYHSFSENFFHDNSIVTTLNHALQLTDVAIGKCEAMSDREIAKLKRKTSSGSNLHKIQIVFYLGFLAAGVVLAQYIDLDKAWQSLRPITKMTAVPSNNQNNEIIKPLQNHI